VQPGLVSVVIPAYNAGWCVERAVDSALAQSHAAREVIVVDDGSTDDTAVRLAGYGARIRVLRQANAGLSAARNTGIEAADGEFVAFLDADDWWLPSKLERQVALLRQRPDIGFCSTAAQVVAPDGSPLNLWACPPATDNILEAIFQNLSLIPGSGSGVVLRRALVERTGAFDGRLRSLEDVDMWLRLASVTGYACVPEPLTVILRNPSSMSRNLPVMRTAAIEVLRKHRGLLPPHRRGRFWQSCYAAVLADYAKWEYRDGRRGEALAHLFEALARSPLDRGRLALGLLAAMLRGQPV
jgi:glycosyltransferase involved in cell wall biosynthesis